MLKQLLSSMRKREDVTIPEGPRAHFIMRRPEMEWANWLTRELVGWKHNKPMVGDYLFCEMESGKVAVFRFLAITLVSRTQFRASMRDVGYALNTRTAVADDGTEVPIEPDERFGANYDYAGDSAGEEVVTVGEDDAA